MSGEAVAGIDVADTNEPLGTLVAQDTVRIERIMPASIDKVWTYIIDSEKRALWFAGGPVGMTGGGAMTLTFQNARLSQGRNKDGSPASPDDVDHVLKGLVVRCEPPHVFQFNWEHDGTGSETTFELESVGDFTKLVITHKKLSNRRGILSVSSGWHTHIGILMDLLASQSPRAFWPSYAQVEARYDAILPE